MTNSPLEVCVHPRMQRSHLAIAFALAFLAGSLAQAQSDHRIERLDVAVETPVYRVPGGLPLPDEALRYRLRWTGIPLGGVELAMHPDDGGSALAVAIRGATWPAISWLYDLRFTGQGRVRTAPFAPGGFELESCEGDRHKHTRILFPEGDGPIRSIRQKRGRTTEYFFHSDNAYDVPSAIYLVLNLDYSPGDRYQVDAFTGEERYLVTADVVGRETVGIGNESVSAWRLELGTRPLIDDDDERKHRGTSVWISDERPRRLLRAKTSTFVGSVTLELEGETEALASAHIDSSCPQSTAALGR